MEEISGENTIIEVEVPINDPVTIIDVNDDPTEQVAEKSESDEPEKPSLPPIFSSKKRLLTGSLLLILLIIPTVGGGYLSYLLRKEKY